jgi:arsenate reductase (thioredoxin)
MIDRERYRIVREDLHRAYDDQLDPAVIDRVLDETAAEAERTASVTTFLPVTVGRATIDKLEGLAATRAAGGLTPRPEVLFVSGRNAGRSQFAAAYAHHLAGDRVFIRAVGIESNDEPAESVLKVLRERGISEEGLYNKEIIARTVHRSDVIVLLGVEETPDLPGDRYEHWPVADPAGRSEMKVREIADNIERRVRELLDRLGVLEGVA